MAQKGSDSCHELCYVYEQATPILSLSKPIRDGGKGKCNV